MATTQDLKKSNDEAAIKGKKVEAQKQASLADCLKQFHSTLKPEEKAATELAPKPAAK